MQLFEVKSRVWTFLWDKNSKKDENNEKRSLTLKVVETSNHCIIEWNVGWNRPALIRGFMK